MSQKQKNWVTELHVDIAERGGGIAMCNLGIETGCNDAALHVQTVIIAIISLVDVNWMSLTLYLFNDVVLL